MDIKAQEYKRLLGYAMKTSDAFMLVYFSQKKGGRLSRDVNKIKQGLKPYRIKKRHNPDWPSTTSLDKRNKYIIEVYKSSLDVMDILLKPDSLFSWMPPHFPEDLSFFSHNKCWLSTSAHGKYLDVFIRTPEDYDTFTSLLSVYEENDVESSDMFYEEYSIIE